MTRLSNKLSKVYDNYDWIMMGLLAVIILLPKFQLIPINGTYINVRIEDFLVVLVYAVWGIGLLGGRFDLSRVFNYRVLIFYLAYGFIITLLGILVMDSIEQPHLGVLHWLRRVEYFGMFFIVGNVAKRENLHKYIYVMLIIGATTWIYGYLQWLDVLPGVHTLSKAGQLGTFSELGYVISTFAAHYDFGAFLMLMMMLSVWGYFSHSTWWKRVLFVVTALSFWWMSRLVYGRAAYLGTLVGLVTILTIRMSGWVLVPLWEIVMTFDRYFSGRFSKYAYEFKFNILPEAPPTPTPVPAAVTPTPGPDVIDYLNETIPEPDELLEYAVDEAKKIPEEGVPAPNQLKVGLDQLINEWSPKLRSLIGRYEIGLDPSANIRMKEWQDALARVGYNFMWGTGYASMSGVGLDNDYLRKVVEVGVIGLAMFLLILFDFIRVTFSLYRTTLVPHVKYFHLAMLGFIIGLMVEAIFIDIFEASKIAFTFWFMMGLVSIYAMPYRDQEQDKDEMQESPVRNISDIVAKSDAEPQA